MIRSGVIFIVMLLSSAISAQDVLTFYSDDGVHLRWKGSRETALSGYDVFRKEAGTNDWQLLNENRLTMISAEAEIKAILGHQSRLYYSLFKLETGDIGPDKFAVISQERNARNFFEAICVINPKFGEVLGEVYLDRTAQKGKSYTYRIVAYDPSERILAETSTVKTSSFSKVPGITGMEGQAENQGAVIQWNRMKEQMEDGLVVSYNIYRSTEKYSGFKKLNNFNALSIDFEAGSKESFVDEYLENGKTYYYAVRAMNAFGIESAQSKTIAITPQDLSAPDTPIEIEIQPLGNQLLIRWVAASENIQSFKIYESAMPDKDFEFFHEHWKTPGNQQQWITTKFNDGKDHYFYIVSASENELESEPSLIYRAFLPDIAPPSAPLNLQAETDTGLVVLNWTANKEKDLMGYYVERASDEENKIWIQLNSLAQLENTFKDTLAKMNETEYAYRVLAVDHFGNRSDASETVTAILPDLIPPLSVQLYSLEGEGSSITLLWMPSISPDVSKYKVWMKSSMNSDFSAMADIEGTTWQYTLADFGTYEFMVTAHDANNQSDNSNVFTYEYKKDTSPQQPVNGSLEKEGAGVRLSWENTNDSNIAGYLITRKDLSENTLLDIGELSANQREFLDLYLKPNRDYQYQIRSFNEAWIISEPLILEYKSSD